MSQAKVDRHKEQKAHRKEIVEKQRKQRLRSKVISIVIALLVLAGVGTGVGLTIRNSYIRKAQAKPDYTVSSLMISDYTGILEDGEAEASE